MNSCFNVLDTGGYNKYGLLEGKDYKIVNINNDLTKFYVARVNANGLPLDGYAELELNVADVNTYVGRLDLVNFVPQA